MTECISQALKDLLPEHPHKRYAPIEVCIYCGSKQNLSDEHIIPYGFGGRWVLPKASCFNCAKKTSQFEMVCLRTMYGPLRQLYDLPSRKGKADKLPLKIKYVPSNEWQTVLVDQVDYPFLVGFPYFSLPNLVSGAKDAERTGATTKRIWIRGASAYVNFDEHLKALSQRLKAYELFPEFHLHVKEFCQMLVKTAYSYAVAELGYGVFKPFLLPHIVQDELSNCADFIGSLEKDEIPGKALHELFICNTMRGDIAVRVRFLAKLGTPTYFVVVGSVN